MKITVTATQEERLDVVKDALSNTWLFGRSLCFLYDHTLYKRTSAELRSSGVLVTIEDVYIKMLENGAVLKVIDTEDDNDIVGELSLAKIEENWDKIAPTDILDMINERDDADTADNILQCITLGDIVYG